MSFCGGGGGWAPVRAPGICGGTNFKVLYAYNYHILITVNQLYAMLEFDNAFLLLLL